MSDEKRCTETIYATWDGDTDTLRCVKDEGHGVFYYTAKHPNGAHYPSEHRFVIEVEQDEPPESHSTDGES